ncbi:hypothetical protein M406DRAFT_75163 [Cryphonectria parasitica EP155]|uniref:Uncharacterized protein n=1 Tax=Cryphonectria parasitica (strain ATCC 38755 / EP155) TaxID=660469 RepID=A0A9P5CMB5_CRYP1|nr:uncharacterized protein M406DRAFT_75163 [Cryphonectria parasitica EP155]KAF3763938.1 hypothetical protein M406DRAFT_75163 [Cryphonectria parasitica EP155]
MDISQQVRYRPLNSECLDVFCRSKATAASHLVVTMLRREGVCIPEPLSIAPAEQNGPGYDYEYWSQSVFHALDDYDRFEDEDYAFAFSIGFRDLDEPDIEGRTPLYGLSIYGRVLMSCYFSYDRMLNIFRKYLWLMEHGADPWTRLPLTDATVAHYIYMSLVPEVWGMSKDVGGSIKDLLGHIEIFFDKFSTLFYDTTRHLALSNPRDHYRCRCSPGGCPPIIWLLRGFSHMLTKWCAYQTRVPESLAETIDLILAKGNPFWTGDQLKSAVRYWTFEALELRHTCNHGGEGEYFQGMDEEEIDEILEEDVFVLSILEELMEEFETRLNLGQESEIVRRNVSFWNEIWLPRVREVRDSLSSHRMRDNQKRQCEEIGVV